MNVIEINGEVMDAEEFVRVLRVNGALIETAHEIAQDQLLARHAHQLGLEVELDELQQRADDLRQSLGLHSARDTLSYLDQLGWSVDQLETHLENAILADKARFAITGNEAVETYFRLNSPDFERIDTNRIVVESEGAAQEIVALLEEDVELFGELAKQHSTSDDGGAFGIISRAEVTSNVESQIFNADIGVPIGPIASADNSYFEIFVVLEKQEAELNEETRELIYNVLLDQWFMQQMEENTVVVG